MYQLLLVLLDVFIVSYKIAKHVKEISRGSVMGRYFNANEFVYSLLDDLGSSYAEVVFA